MVQFPPLAQLFDQQSTKLGQSQAFLYYSEEQWRNMSWSDYRSQVVAVAGFLSERGVGRGDRVGILSANRPEWMIVDLAILWIGAVSVPIYATSSADDIRYIAEHSGAKLFFIDHAQRAQALKSVKISGFVLFDSFERGEVDQHVSHCYGFAEVLASEYRPEIVQVSPEEFATIIYTSGTTGTPKGVVHTHGNIMAVMSSLHPVLLNPTSQPDRFFSFLPLSHVAERVLVQIGSIMTGSEVAFARSVSTLGEDLVRCRPSVLLCVPRLWEKMHERILIGVKKGSAVQRLIFWCARYAGRERIRDNVIFEKKICGPFSWLSEVMVGRRLRAKLGLDRARLLATGSAPTRRDVVEFFASFGLFIREVYGLTENLCLGVYQQADRLVLESCGRPFEGNKMRIAEDGEVLFQAPWIFREYYKNAEASLAAKAGDWFATGDLGRIDNDGYLYIVGRKKELLKTSTGKYVAPVPIEDQLKIIPFVQEAMLVGDNEKYCIAIISVDRSLDKSDVKLELIAHVERINAKLAHHESIKRIGILSQGFSVEKGTLTPTLKLKRKAAFDQNLDFIRKVYGASEMVVWQD